MQRAAAARALALPYPTPTLRRAGLPKVSSPDGDASALCISAIIPGGDARAVILGNNFMRSWFTVYTYNAGSRAAHVGFAAAAALATSRR